MRAIAILILLFLLNACKSQIQESITIYNPADLYLITSHFKNDEKIIIDGSVIKFNKSDADEVLEYINSIIKTYHYHNIYYDRICKDSIGILDERKIEYMHSNTIDGCFIIVDRDNNEILSNIIDGVLKKYY